MIKGKRRRRPGGTEAEALSSMISISSTPSFLCFIFLSFSFLSPTGCEGVEEEELANVGAEISTLLELQGMKKKKKDSALDTAAPPSANNWNNNNNYGVVGNGVASSSYGGIGSSGSSYGVSNAYASSFGSSSGNSTCYSPKAGRLWGRTITTVCILRIRVIQRLSEQRR